MKCPPHSILLLALAEIEATSYETAARTPLITNYLGIQSIQLGRWLRAAAVAGHIEYRKEIKGHIHFSLWLTPAGRALASPTASKVT